MKQSMLLLATALFFILCCEKEKSKPDHNRIVGTYKGGGNWSDGTFAGYIFNTTISINPKEQHYIFNIADKTIFRYPELEFEIYEAVEGKYYFHILDNPDYIEAHIANDDFNYIDFTPDPNYVDPHAKLNLAISMIDPDSTYSLHYYGTRNLALD